MWPDGYITSSAIVIASRCHPRPPPSSSSAIVLVVHHHRPSVCQKSAPPHFTCYIRRFHRQNLCAIYQLQHPHICILPLAIYNRWHLTKLIQCDKCVFCQINKSSHFKPISSTNRRCIYQYRRSSFNQHIKLNSHRTLYNMEYKHYCSMIRF